MRHSLLISVCATSLMLLSSAAYAQSAPDKKDEPKTEHAQPTRPGEMQDRMQKERSNAPAEKHATEQKPSGGVAGGAAERDTNKAENKAEERERGERTQNAQQHDARPGETRDHKQSADENGKPAAEPARKSANEEHRGESPKQAEKQGERPGERNTQNSQGAPATSTNQAERNGTTPGDRNATNQAERNEGPQHTARTDNRLPQDRVARISTTMSHERMASPEHDVNFGIGIGATIPERVHFYPLPAEIVGIEPDYRDYDYFATDADYVIVDPRSHVVVNTIPRDASNLQAYNANGPADGGGAGPAPGSAAGQSYAAGGGTSGDSQCQVQRNDTTVGAAGGAANTLSFTIRGNCQVTIGQQ